MAEANSQLEPQKSKKTFMKKLFRKQKDKDFVEENSQSDPRKKFPLSKSLQEQSHPKSVPLNKIKIIDLKNGKFILREEVLSSILMQPDVKDEPVMVLSVVGMFRKGKSFLLSLLIKYLSSNCNQYWIHDTYRKLSGFVWSGGTDAVTTGIWMWNELFSITGSEGQKMRVALVDTQGTQDPNTTTNNDSLMFALNAAVSSILIYNAVSDVNETDFRFLELAIKHGMAIKDSSSPFQFLMFLIRDWSNELEYNFGERGGKARLETSMGQGERDARKVIKDGFKELSCFLLPHPGKNVANGQTDGSLKEIDEDFVKHVNDLAQMIFSSTFTKPLEIDGVVKTCGGLFDIVKTYMTHAEEVDFKVDSPTEANAKAQNLDVRNEVVQKCEKELEKYHDKYCTNIEEIFEDLKEKALKEFHERCLYNKCKNFDTIVKDLTGLIEKIFQNFKIYMNLKKADARIQNQENSEEAVETFKNIMDEKCSKYWEPEDLQRLYKLHQDKAIQQYEKEGNQFGPSYEEFLKISKQKFKKKKSMYDKENQMHLEKRMTEAYKEALLEYELLMKKRYSQFQDPANFQLFHEKARMQAIDLYKEKIGKISEEDLNNLEEAMSNIRTDYENDCERRTETAKEKNNAMHDVALHFYRDEMTKEHLYLSDKFEWKHKEIKRQAEDKYEKASSSGFPSYHSNLKDLQTAIETVKAIMARERPVYSWYYRYGLPFNLGMVSIPKHLFKN